MASRSWLRCSRMYSSCSRRTSNKSPWSVGWPVAWSVDRGRSPWAIGRSVAPSVPKTTSTVPSLAFSLRKVPRLRRERIASSERPKRTAASATVTRRSVGRSFAGRSSWCWTVAWPSVGWPFVGRISGSLNHARLWLQGYLSRPQHLWFRYVRDRKGLRCKTSLVLLEARKVAVASVHRVAEKRSFRLLGDRVPRAPTF